ncbi:hypothetical protein B0H14DRAFT_2573021 [Mycena olivaceomarginata]|nr:hypothetical protein B0H14DRAFT_2573021 [Mycena olivaceomarginata]
MVKYGYAGPHLNTAIQVHQPTLEYYNTGMQAHAQIAKYGPVLAAQIAKYGYTGLHLNSEIQVCRPMLGYRIQSDTAWSQFHTDTPESEPSGTALPLANARNTRRLGVHPHTANSEPWDTRNGNITEVTRISYDTP